MKHPIFDLQGPLIAAPQYGREPTLREMVSRYYHRTVKAELADKLTDEYIAHWGGGYATTQPFTPEPYQAPAPSMVASEVSREESSFESPPYTPPQHAYVPPFQGGGGEFGGAGAGGDWEPTTVDVPSVTTVDTPSVDTTSFDSTSAIDP